MTTRDPRSRVPPRPDTGRGAVREVTASMSIDLGELPAAPPEDDNDERVSHPSLAVGTGLPSDVRSSARQEATAIASPSGRNRTPQPKPTRPPTTAKSGDDPQGQLGTVLGTYKLVELLGKGGMGYVYRAEHTKLGREVALKLLRGDYAKRRDAVLRFFQEAKTVNRVRHRNIVDVTDFVELDDGTTFIIMELLRGQSLTRWARAGFDLPRALAVLVQICDGLGAAHAVGVVHRDLKPDNVIIVPTSDGAEQVKLLDFGVAKLVNHDEDVGFQTAAGSVIGTPAYMSPEQAGGMLVDHRSDIYSIGAIMYELFCGQPMFRGRSFGEYVRKHLTENPVPPRQTAVGAQIDERLEALILKCLAKEPSQRFDNIHELRDGLLHLLGGIETRPPGAVPPAQLPPPPRTTPGVAPPPPMQTLQGHPATGPVSHGGSSIHSLNVSQYTLLPGTVPPAAPSTPWWIWFIGGTLAVGLGVTAALWYAGRASSPSPATPKPTAAPITAPIETPQPKLVELRFDSLPAGGVYADGRSAELCRTPCNFNVDLGDGGPTDKRTYVVRADGYEDKRVEVDFGVSQRDFSVSLTRLPGAATVSQESAQILDVAKEPGDAHKVTKKSHRAKKGKTDESKTDTKAVETKAEPEPKVEEPPPPPPPPKSEEKKIKKIDRTDTIDPFKK